jgi:N-methylhydantoinase A/oxoprolinase/acetone carboxylase beta subunit
LKRGQDREDVPVYDLSRLTHGHRILGPALAESEQTTIFVDMGWKMTLDRYSNAILEEVMER